MKKNVQCETNCESEKIFASNLCDSIVTIESHKLLANIFFGYWS